MKYYYLILTLVFTILFSSEVLAQETTVQLPTNDNTSSFNVTRSDGTDLLKVQADGKIGIGESDPATTLDVDGTVTADKFLGDGSQLSNVKPVAAYQGGSLFVQLAGEETKVVRSVTIQIPAAGIVLVSVDGFAEFWSAGEDCLRASISTGSGLDLPYINVLTDMKCPDPDQQASWSMQRGYTFSSGGTYTFNCVCNSYWANSDVRIRNVNMSAVYFPTGGTTGNIPAPSFNTEETDREFNTNSKFGD